jgi:hypothetical protein
MNKSVFTLKKDYESLNFTSKFVVKKRRKVLMFKLSKWRFHSVE